MASENGALPGGKVGGLGDVIRDLPLALAGRGQRPVVLTPAYGVFAELPGARRLAAFEVAFAGKFESVTAHEVPGASASVQHIVLDHPRFAPRRPGLIYTGDYGEGPFETDASKFAFFCAAAAGALSRKAIPLPDVIHLHDWQTALLLALRAFAPEHKKLRKIRTVFTIHNLSMQGVRPLSGGESSLRSWFPDLDVDLGSVTDPRWTDCVNPMATGIRLADAINTVSPTYAREILEPSDPARAYSGGEGLEADLRKAHAAGRLSGILNGCEYPSGKQRRPGYERVLETIRSSLAAWIAREPQLSSAHYIADKKLARVPRRRPAALLTSIGRITDQKTRLFRERTATGTSALEAILEVLGDHGLLVMVGTGDPEYERFLISVAGDRDNFVFLNGYSDKLAETLYAAGDLFLMPSSFEPCGISQMLAMRCGQPCVVHAVGGLRDTVEDGVSGFVFCGATPTEQAEAFVATVSSALELRHASPERWKRIRMTAAAARFSWDISAAEYERTLYAFPAER